MTSHGMVFDLFDDRYLELQDVVGNVEPLPTLVPYEQYKQHLITYRMDTSHEVFLALLQDFTARKAIETGKELWTWCVQWHVDGTATKQPLEVPHSPKKPRLDSGKPNPQHKTGPITAQARIIDPELMHEEDMQRILVDIVQVNSAVVPNFIEFLYRWIDFYEGDGKALKAALRGEIPSLWDFEYHPLVVPEDVKKKVHEASGGSKDKPGDMGDKTPKHSDAEELAQNSPTKKMREKPDLAALERKAEKSERLQYREVHFGIQPPKLNEPLPPLINIPRDPQKRSRYYAACFKSRQRAFYMLMEAGVTPQHMRDYNRGQKENVKDTPLVEGNGLQNYERDAQTAQKVFLEKEKHRKKQMEIAISNRLADEAQAAARRIVPEGVSGVPLIPATPSYAHRSDMAGQMLRKIQQTRDGGGQKINSVPTPLVGKMKSKLFEGAKDKEAVLASFGSGPVLPTPRLRSVDDRFEPFSDSAVDGGTDQDLDDEGSQDSDKMRLPSRPSLPPPNFPRPSLSPLAQILGPNQAHQAFGPSIASTLRQDTPGHTGFLSPATTPSRTPTPPHIAEYMRNLTPEQARQLLTLIDQHAVQGVQDDSSVRHMIPRPSNPLVGFGQSLPSSMLVLAPPCAPAITISPPHAPNNESQHQAPRGFQRSYSPFTMQPPVGLANLHASSTLTPGTNDQLMAGQPQRDPHRLPPSPTPFLTPPRPGMQHSAPSPLSLHPPPSPLSCLAPSLLATSPFAISRHGIPLQIYFPKLLVPGNTIGPGGAKLGNGGSAETDAFLLGHAHAGSGKITLNKAVFLPVGVWQNAVARVKKGKYSVLESYPAPGPSIPNHTTGVPHRAAYRKMKDVYGFMVSAPPLKRERELTKRWRVSKGMVTASERGAVWEGWGVEVDRGVSLSREERSGALVHDRLIDGEDVADRERERRRREIGEMLEEEEALEYMEMEM